MKITYAIACVLGMIATAQAETLLDVLNDKHPELVEKFGNSGALMDAMTAFKEDPSSFSDIEQEFLKDVMEDETDDHPEGNHDDDGHGRRLGSIDSLKNKAWAMVKSRYTSSNTVVDNSVFGGQDRVKVVASGDTCYITAEESNDFGDWWRNVDVGYQNIAGAGYTVNVRYCTRKTWGWCRRWGTRTEYRAERGHDGFVKAFNNMKGGIETLMSRHCSGKNKFVYVGYSRGGGIIQAAALSHFRRGIVKGNHDVRMVTFGSPRCLEPRAADHLEKMLDQSIRVVKTSSNWMGNSYDPVATVPAGWWGFQHVGSVRVPGDLGHNSPTFGANYNFGLHTQYP